MSATLCLAGKPTSLMQPICLVQSGVMPLHGAIGFSWPPSAMVWPAAASAMGIIISQGIPAEAMDAANLAD